MVAVISHQALTFNIMKQLCELSWDFPQIVFVTLSLRIHPDDNKRHRVMSVFQLASHDQFTEFDSASQSVS
jgi:hypothetical protein